MVQYYLCNVFSELYKEKVTTYICNCIFKMVNWKIFRAVCVVYFHSCYFNKCVLKNFNQCPNFKIIFFLIHLNFSKIHNYFVLLFLQSCNNKLIIRDSYVYTLSCTTNTKIIINCISGIRVCWQLVMISNNQSLSLCKKIYISPVTHFILLS